MFLWRALRWNYFTINKYRKNGDFRLEELVLCSEGRIPGATKIGSYWAIPAEAEKPKDARIKSGKYVISASNREC